MEHKKEIDDLEKNYLEDVDKDLSSEIKNMY